MRLRQRYKKHAKKKHDDNVTDIFSFVPDEVLLYMFSFFGVADLLSLCAVSQRMRKLASDDWLWKRFILNYLTNDEEDKLNQSCMTFFFTQHKASKISGLFNKVRNEELRFEYLSYYEIEKDFRVCPTPLLISYAFFLNVNPVTCTELKYLFVVDQQTIANHLLKKLPVIYHSNDLVLKEIYRFVSKVIPSSIPPNAYTHTIYQTNHDFPLLYLYAALQKCAEKNPYEMIFFKGPSFFRELNDFLAQDGLQGNKLIILGETLMANPEIVYTEKTITFLRDMLGFLKNTAVTCDDLFGYYQNSLHAARLR